MMVFKCSMMQLTTSALWKCPRTIRCENCLTNFFLSFLGVRFFTKTILKTHSETLLFVRFQVCMKKILTCPVHASAYIPLKSLGIKIILLYGYMKHLFKHFKIDSGGNKIMVFASLYFQEFIRAFPLQHKRAEVQILHKLRSL